MRTPCLFKVGCPLHGGASGVSVPYGNVQATPAEQGATETGRPSFRDIGALCFVPTRLFTTRVGLTDTAGLESEWAKAPYCPSLRGKHGFRPAALRHRTVYTGST